MTDMQISRRACHRPYVLILLGALVTLATFGVSIAKRDRASQAQQEMSALAPQIQSVTIYDIHGFHGSEATRAELSSATAASFPPEVFAQAAASATHSDETVLWKGSSLAVIKLRDGTERRAAFSYYGGFFMLHGTPGYFRVPGGNESEFDLNFHRVIRDHFIPARRAKNAPGGAS